MLLFPFMLIRQYHLQPAGLSLGDCCVHERWIVQNREFFTTAVAAKSAHLPEVRRPFLPMASFDRYGSHQSCYPPP